MRCCSQLRLIDVLAMAINITMTGMLMADSLDAKQSITIILEVVTAPPDARLIVPTASDPGR
jgi:hypothetical protein